MSLSEAFYRLFLAFMTLIILVSTVIYMFGGKVSLSNFLVFVGVDILIIVIAIWIHRKITTRIARGML
jgi:hypothetical protein